MILELIEIAIHHWDQRRIDHGGTGSLVFTDLRVNIRGQADHDLGPQLCTNQLGHFALMRRIQVGINQTHRNCLNVLRRQRANDLARLLDIQRPLDCTIPKDPFAHFQAQPARDEGPGPHPVWVLQVRPPLTPHLQVVAEAAGGNITGGRGRTFDDRIGGDGCAVHKIIDVLRGA